MTIEPLLNSNNAADIPLKSQCVDTPSGRKPALLAVAPFTRRERAKAPERTARAMKKRRTQE